MISVSGVRGIFGRSLTPLVVSRFSAQFGIFCRRGKIVVGRDSRTTGSAMFHSIVSSLLSVGCQVIDIGIVPTPTVLLAVKYHQADGGISITASHNPPQWNAMKFVDQDGMFLSPERAESFLATVEDEIQWSDWRSMGNLTHDNLAISHHIHKVLSIPYVGYDKIKSRRFRVVIDSVNGAGGLISPLLLQELGCEVIELNSDPNGVFAHPAEPLNENLIQLEQAVVKHNADIGFATDPDVDRLAIVSDKGKCIGEELSIALAELYVLSRKKGDIVVNLSSSMISDDIAAQFGVKVHRVKVGEINVGKKMQQILSPIGGEGNGGIICPEVHYTRDALAGMVLILALLSETDSPLSEIVAALPQYYFAKGKIETIPENIDRIMQAAYQEAGGKKHDLQDGVKIYGDKYWIHIRISGTEPIIRVFVESDSPHRAHEICQDIIKKISGGKT